MTAHPADSPTPPGHDLELAHPTVTDGPVLHELAAAAGGLDVNTRYAYLIWARDFARTTVIARRGGEPVIGQGPGIDGCFIAFSHSGATLGLVIGEMLADEIALGLRHPLLASFRPDRFGA